MNQEERNQALLRAEGLFRKAQRIESAINWHNDEERDSLIGELENVMREANWLLSAAISNKGV